MSANEGRQLSHMERLPDASYDEIALPPNTCVGASSTPAAQRDA